jgi:aminoglycoside/choline kinase family phosphotransferase
MEQPASPPPRYDFDRDIELLQQWKVTAATQHSARTTSLETWASAFTAVVLVCAIVATVLVTVLR